MSILFSPRWLLLLAVSLPLCLFAREPAQVRLYCMSLVFAPATGGGGQGFTFELTTAPGASEINHELGPLFDQRFPTHGAFFRLHDPGIPDPLVGQIAFDQPAPEDRNENGFDDFFEVSQAVESVTTFGFFTTAVDSGSVTATWSRPVGSASGTCQLQLRGEVYGTLPEFTHSFELIEYTGTLAYTPATNAITGTLALVQTGTSSNTFTGAVTLTRSATNRFNDLLLSAGTLTNATGDPLPYMATPLERDLVVATNYFGFFEFADGDPTTSTADFLDWVMSIDDPNDTNENGIPDLTDDPPAPPAEPPLLGLSRSENQLLLSISAGVGRTFDLEEIVSLTETNWTQAISVTATNDPQIVELPLPSGATRFWRLRGR
jgi:hypothetical protein